MLSRAAQNSSRKSAGARAIALNSGLFQYLKTLYGIGYDRAHQIIREYDPEGAGLVATHVNLTDDEPAERASKAKVELDPATVTAARRRVRQLQTEGKTVVWHELAQWLRENTPDSDTSDSVFRRRLIEEGFGSLRTKAAPAQDMTTPYWTRQRDRFVLELAAAWEEEAAGRAVVVFVDESFIHRNVRRKRTITDTTDPQNIQAQRRAKPAAVLRSGAGKGQLTILVHALTRDGLLCERDPATGNYKRKTIDSSVFTAEVIYASKKNGESDDELTYHAHWDSHSFMLWVRQQLIPVFQKIYGVDKRMYLVLDNSANHCKRRADYTRVSSTKAAVASALIANGVTQLHVDRGLRSIPAQRPKGGRKGKPALTEPARPARVERDIKRFTAAEFAVNAPLGPSAVELQDRLRALYVEKPELGLSQLELLFRNGVWSSLSFALVHARA